MNCPNCRECIGAPTTFCRKCGSRLAPAIDDELTSEITQPISWVDPPRFSRSPQRVVPLAYIEAPTEKQPDEECESANIHSESESPDSVVTLPLINRSERPVKADALLVADRRRNMSNQLSHVPDASVDDLRQVSTAMKDYVETENESSMQAVVYMIKHKPGFFARLFPTAYEEELERITLDRMRTMYNAKKQFFELYTRIQLEIARKQGDALIASVGMDLQGKLTQFATKKIEEMSETIGTSRQKFIERITPQLQDLDRYKAIPEVYGPARQSVQNEIKTYFQGIDELLNGFIEALKSKVSNSKT